MDALRPDSLWRVLVVVFAMLKQIIAPPLTLAEWLAVREQLIPRLREGRRRRVSQAARALWGDFAAPVPPPTQTEAPGAEVG